MERTTGYYEKLRVLVAAHRDIRNPKSGGAAIYLQEVASRLAQMGHEVVVFSSSFGRNEIEVLGGVKVMRRGGIFSHQLIFPFVYFRRFRQHFDLYIEEFGSGVLPFFTSLFCRRPVITLAYQRQREVFFETLPFPLAVMCSWAEAGFLLFAKLFKTRFIAISPSTKNDIVSMGLSPSNVCVCPPGPGKDYGDAKYSLPDTQREDAFLIVSRATPYKGIHYSILAMKHVSDKLPSSKLNVLLQRGDKNYERRLESLVSRLGLGEKVQLLYSVDEQSKTKMLKTAKVLLNTSLKEGFGMVVLEGNVFGVPAIGFDVSGSRDSIVNGFTGILVPPKDYDALSMAMVSLVSNRNLYEAMSKNCRDWIRGFDWDLAASRFETILTKELRSTDVKGLRRSWLM